jgi:hypothetical protein
MQHVPTMDATGLVALESVLDRLHRSKIIFAGLSPEVHEILERAGLKRDPGRLAYAPDVETAISMAIVHAARLGLIGGRFIEFHVCEPQVLEVTLRRVRKRDGR